MDDIAILPDIVCIMSEVLVADKIAGQSVKARDPSLRANPRQKNLISGDKDRIDVVSI